MSDASRLDRLGRGLAHRLAAGTTRRSFLALTGALTFGLVGSRVALAPSGPIPGTERIGGWYGFCGHYFTTGSCRGPHRLPRVDLLGLPVRPADGRPIDNLGRVVDARGLPVSELGEPLFGPDGEQLPRAPRTRLCEDWVPELFGVDARTQGAWYRCCEGQIRKLSDCCTTAPRRINDDGGQLQGYCNRGRHVFCVMYVDTGAPC